MKINLKQIERNNWWPVCAGILRLVEVIAIVGGVIFAALQIQDLQNDQSAQMMLQFNSSLSEPTNSALITTIENGQPVLVQNGGKFTTTDLDRYLSVYDLLDEVFVSGLISNDMLYNGFSYDIVITYKDKEIQDYISSVQAQNHDNTLFAGYESLAQALDAVQN